MTTPLKDTASARALAAPPAAPRHMPPPAVVPPPVNHLPPAAPPPEPIAPPHIAASAAPPVRPATGPPPGPVHAASADWDDAELARVRWRYRTKTYDEIGVEAATVDATNGAGGTGGDNTNAHEQRKHEL